MLAAEQGICTFRQYSPTLTTNEDFKSTESDIRHVFPSDSIITNITHISRCLLIDSVEKVNETLYKL